MFFICVFYLFLSSLILRKQLIFTTLFNLDFLCIKESLFIVKEVMTSHCQRICIELLQIDNTTKGLTPLAQESSYNMGGEGF